ncbi:MAG TPA: hypothetical protein VF937_11790 [Chloroflexota bacterium]
MKLTGCMFARVAVVLAAGVLLPGQALAQSAPTTTPPVKAVVVVQQPSAPAQAQPQPQAPGSPKAQVVVQTSSTNGAPAPTARPAALPMPNLTLEAPAAANLGQTLSVRVVLVGPGGAPVKGAPVDFSTSANFLNTPGSIVFAHALTDAQGTASVDWQPRSDGSLTLNAAFAGDKRFAAATASAAVDVTGDQQLYEQQAGVVVPGLNAAPAFTRTAALAPAASPWPRLSGWPLVAVLVIVWSLYARAVLVLFTIARGGEPKAATGAIR